MWAWLVIEISNRVSTFKVNNIDTLDNTYIDTYHLLLMMLGLLLSEPMLLQKQTLHVISLSMNCLCRLQSLAICSGHIGRHCSELFNHCIVLHSVDVQRDFLNRIVVGWMLLPDAGIAVLDAP